MVWKKCLRASGHTTTRKINPPSPSNSGLRQGFQPAPRAPLLSPPPGRVSVHPVAPRTFPAACCLPPPGAPGPALASPSLPAVPPPAAPSSPSNSPGDPSSLRRAAPRLCLRTGRGRGFPARARGAPGAAHSPAAAGPGPRRGAAAAGAWCRSARLRSCARSPASRASPPRGAGRGAPGTLRGAGLRSRNPSAARAGRGRRPVRPR